MSAEGVLLALVAGVLVVLLAMLVRRVTLQRAGGTVELSLRLSSPEIGRAHV